MTFSHKITLTISMIMLGIGIPHYLKYQQAHSTAKKQEPLLATSLATEGKISVQSIILITTITDLHDLVAQTKTTQPLIVKVIKVDCSACQRMLDPYARAAGNFQDRILFAEIDFGQLSEPDKNNVRHELRLTEVPTFIGYVDGKEALRFSGVRTDEQLNRTLNHLLDIR
ncbi:MAG: thioredoxin family protein [Candidatus Babeliales bacterium]